MSADVCELEQESIQWMCSLQSGDSGLVAVVRRKNNINSSIENSGR